MKTVDAERIFTGVNELWHGTSELQDSVDWPVVRGHIDLTLAEAWNSEWWQFLMAGEYRYFRDLWSATTTYNKTNEVYDSASQKYFQCLRNSVSGSGNSPTDSTGATRSAYWAESKTSYAGSNWSSSSVSYSVGDIVKYPVDDQYYQCHTAHTSSATLTPDATGSNERWGVLTAFRRYVDYSQTGKTEFGDVFDVKDGDPYVSTNWNSVEHETINDRVYVRDNIKRVWVDYRLVKPRLTGSAYSATATYAAGDQVYYVPSGGKGNFYTCLASTSAGENPTSTPAKWSIVQIPLAFEGALIWGAYAKCLTADGDAEERTAAMQMAEGYLSLETDRKYRQKGETPAVSMRTYK